MVKIKYYHYLLIILLFIIQGCSKSNPSDSREEKNISESTPNDSSIVSPNTQNLVGSVNIENKNDDEKLLLINYLPLDITYEEAKFRFPNISETRNEGNSDLLGKNGLTEAFINIEIFDLNAKVELNFKNNKLYSYCYFLMDIDLSLSSTIYDKLKSFYSKHYGEFEEDNESEHNYLGYHCRWKMKDFEFGITNNVYEYNNTATLGWGYQKIISYNLTS